MKEAYENALKEDAQRDPFVYLPDHMGEYGL